jgi:hypothetical protein
MSTSDPMSVLDAATSARTTMRAASTESTIPSRLARVQTPESWATLPSIPVPTSGEKVRSSGTAWRCMFEPMRARFASSFSRNGISEAATDTSWFGETSISWMSSGRAWMNSPPLRQEMSPVSVMIAPFFLSKTAFAWAIVNFSSSSAE